MAELMLCALLTELNASVWIVLTLFDIMMVSRDLLCELKATLRVEAWTMMRMAWRTDEQPFRKTTDLKSI